MTASFKRGYLTLTIAILLTAIAAIATTSLYPASTSDPILGAGWRCWRLAGFASCSRLPARDAHADPELRLLPHTEARSMVRQG
jgi:hypothetical protein